MATVLTKVVYVEEELHVELVVVVVAVVEAEVQGAAADTGEVVASAALKAEDVASVVPEAEAAVLAGEGPKVLVQEGMVLGYTGRLY